MSDVLTTDRIRKIRESLNEALRSVSVAHGVKLDVGTIRFTGTTFSARVEGHLATAESPEAAAFKRNATLLGIDPNALGQSYEDRGRTYRITGMAPRGNRVHLERDDGKAFVSPYAPIALRFPAGETPADAKPIAFQPAGSTDALGRVLSDMNSRNALFNRAQVERPTTPEGCWPIFDALCGLLSPENLAADGERPRREVQRLRSLYLRAWADLEKIAGRPVTEEEVWNRVSACGSNSGAA